MANKEEAIEHLRRVLPMGSTVFGIRKKKTTDGEYADFYSFYPLRGDPRMMKCWLTRYMAAALDLDMVNDQEEGDILVLKGIGTNRKADTVQNLAYALYENDDALTYDTL